LLSHCRNSAIIFIIDVFGYIGRLSRWGGRLLLDRSDYYLPSSRLEKREGRDKHPVVRLPKCNPLNLVAYNFDK
jgi:hypothetical protein